MGQDANAGATLKRGESYVKQLDVLRGFAIVLMIVNHAGFTLFEPRLQQESLIASFIFVGSLAPVVFFFTTGFGIGIARTGVTLQDFRSTLFKALLLILADQFFFWSQDIPYGLDFLSFIAISTIFVTAIAAHDRPVRISLILIGVFFLLRFVLGPILRPHVILPPIFNWITGNGGIEGISYPLSPWIIYPLLGFIMARLYVSTAGSMTRWLWPWPTVIGGTNLLMAIAMSLTSARFFRWGTVNLAFFVLSLGAIYLLIIGIWRFQARLPHMAGLLSLRGIASLAVVPIHYAAIEVSTALNIMPGTVATAALLLIVLIASSISLANRFAALIRHVSSKASRVVAGSTLFILVLVSTILIWLAAPRSFAIFIYVLVGQLSIAGLLAARNSATMADHKGAVSIDT